MDLVTCLVRALLLLALLLAVAPSSGVAKEHCPRSCHCPRSGWVDCQHADLATVPPASHRWALTVLDFTGNSITAAGKHAWKDYPWTETLVLRDNEVRTLKSHSLEGLFLLKHLDLSCNEILSIEERAFEPLPFLKLLNLSGNGLTQIHSGTFQAWHGMQFLQELILSHNPLAVIADAAFFKLPSVSSLDLSATHVTPQTLLLLLQTTSSLETLQVPKAVACCLCQERPLPERPCRSIQFLCEKQCSTSALQCGESRGAGEEVKSATSLEPGEMLQHCPILGSPDLPLEYRTWTKHLGLKTHKSLVQTQGEIMDKEQPRKPNTSPKPKPTQPASLKSKEPLLGDHGTITLEVALTLSTEGDASSLDNSRTNSYPPQHLLGHKGKTSVDDLIAKFKKMLHKSKSTRTAKSILSHQPQPARLKDMVEKTRSSWDQEEMESHLNWHRLNPSDVAGGLIHASNTFATGKHRGEEEDPAPRKNIRAHKWNKKVDSQYRVGQNQLFYQVWRPVKVEREPRADQRLNRNLDFLSDLLVQSHPAASSRGEATAEEEHSSLGRHPQTIPDTTEKEGSMFLNKPWSPQSPDLALVPRELLETTVNHHQQFLEPDKGLRMFMAHVERALRMDCSLPQLKQACAKMVSKTRLLLNVLSEREENQGASDHMDQCRLQENMIVHMALGKGKNLTRKKLEAVVYVITFVVLLSFFIFFLLILKCVFQVSQYLVRHTAVCLVAAVPR
ncbi:hypothetical protein Nmel_004610 [Mimus melanotis]